MMLPVELLRHVFLDTLEPVDLNQLEFYYMGWDHEHERLASMSSKPFKIAGVCRTWRRVVLDLSELWSCICIYRTCDESIATTDLYLATMLARAKSSPLDVLFLITPSVNIISSETLDSILDVLARVSARWRTFCLNTPLTCVPAERIVALFSDLTPLLEELQVSLDYRGALRPWPSSFSPVEPALGRTACLPYCPNLRRLRMYHTGPGTVFPCNYLGTFTSLVGISLTYACVDPDSLWNVLQLTPNLESLSVDYIYPENWQDTPSIPTSRLSLPKLRESNLMDPPADMVRNWAGMLDLPRLESLTHHTQTPAEFMAMAPLVAHSLLELSFVSEYCDDGVLPAMATLTKLHSLCLGKLDYVDLALLVRGFNAAHAFLLPNLEILELFWFDFVWEPSDCTTWGTLQEQSRDAARSVLDFVAARNSPAEREAAAAGGRTPPAKSRLLRLCIRRSVLRRASGSRRRRLGIIETTTPSSPVTDAVPSL